VKTAKIAHAAEGIQVAGSNELGSVKTIHPTQSAAKHRRAQSKQGRHEYSHPAERHRIIIEHSLNHPPFG